MSLWEMILLYTIQSINKIKTPKNRMITACPLSHHEEEASGRAIDFEFTSTLLFIQDHNENRIYFSFHSNRVQAFNPVQFGFLGNRKGGAISNYLKVQIFIQYMLFSLYRLNVFVIYFTMQCEPSRVLLIEE